MIACQKLATAAQPGSTGTAQLLETDVLVIVGETQRPATVTVNNQLFGTGWSAGGIGDSLTS